MQADKTKGEKPIRTFPPKYSLSEDLMWHPCDFSLYNFLEVYAIAELSKEDLNSRICIWCFMYND